MVESGKKCLDLEYILKVEPTRISDDFDRGSGGEEITKNYSWVISIIHFELVPLLRRGRLEKIQIQAPAVDMFSEMPIPGGDVIKQWVIQLEFG